MKISFILPCSGRYPIGGFRIIYEYANRLTDIGHEVTLIHLIAPRPNDLSQFRRVRARLQFVRDKLTRGYRPKSWFALHAKVRTKCHFTLSPRTGVVGDVVIASAWQTAFDVARLGPEAGTQFYLIQHFERWNSHGGLVESTWKLPLHKLVISKWLGVVAQKFGQNFALIPNAIDLDFFRIIKRPEHRPPKSILLQCHKMDWKGTMDAIAALRLLKERGIKFQLTLFGLKRPEDLGIDLPHSFVFNPAQSELRDLYNASAIFVAASWSEGWGLTAHEAAACGAALAVTDIDGHREFLEPGQSALMSPARSPEKLADHIQLLLSDNQGRIDLAYRGEAAAKNFSWDRSVALFEEALQRRGDSSWQTAYDTPASKSDPLEDGLPIQQV